MERVEDAFEESVDLDSFMVKKLPILLTTFVNLKELIEEPIIVSLYLKDTGKRYSIEIDPKGKCQCERREMVDFPVVTLVVDSTTWTQFRPFLAQWIPRLLARHKEIASHILLSNAVLKKLSKIDALIDYTIEGGEYLGEGLTVQGNLILNDYEPPSRVKCVSVRFDEKVLWAIVDDLENPAALAGHFKLSGDLAVAAVIGRAFSA